MSDSRYAFSPLEHEEELTAICHELAELEKIEFADLNRVVRRHPKRGGGAYSKSQIIRGVRTLQPLRGWLIDGEQLVARLRTKPIRTASGVAPVTVLTQPYPCPGKCVFCPSDVRMPKSYISSEPGAQRAAQFKFDPYRQCWARLRALANNGHPVGKVELIVLGGTWSSYPEDYRIGFLQRCFDALNEFSIDQYELPEEPEAVDFSQLESGEASYNSTVTEFLQQQTGRPMADSGVTATWESLARVQAANESASSRCVGLVLETRPDLVDEEEVEHLRRLGATKIQIGVQVLDDEILDKNRRGHDVAATRRALLLLRSAGFKLHVHWMPNLLGSTPEKDAEDFRRLFDDEAVRPDELKIYPCSLVETADLMEPWRRGEWHPYGHEELVDLLVRCLSVIPPYCRVSRMIRDIPGTEILVGNLKTNLRQEVEKELESRGGTTQEIRTREIRGQGFEEEDLTLDEVVYSTSLGKEVFLQFLTTEDRLAGFLRLSLPSEASFMSDLGEAAVIREVHIYGNVAGLGQAGGKKAQHRGLGSRLLDRAAEWASKEGYQDLAVISAVGTREYYRRRGFVDRGLYQIRILDREIEEVLSVDPIASSRDEFDG